MSEETATVEDTTAETKETTETTVDQVTTSERPEWLPEKFNDPSELGKAYKELESKLGQKEEDTTAVDHHFCHWILRWFHPNGHWHNVAYQLGAPGPL